MAIVHDYLTQRGGAERVVLSMKKAFPDAPIYTSVYDPARTFPEFADLDVRTTWMQRIPGLARQHRVGLPLYARAFSGLTVEADVVLCSSSGWAHGVSVAPGARKVVYCHNAARWLYQTEEYLGGFRPFHRLALTVGRVALAAWDRRSAETADVYLVNSTVVRDRVREAYGIEASIVPPPAAFEPTAVDSSSTTERPFLLCVSRLLPYKNVAEVILAMDRLPEIDLVIVGDGPMRRSISRSAGSNVHCAGRISDHELRRLYATCSGLVAPSFEDFGLTPIEAATFGKPTAALRAGGYLDTIVEGATGLFFDEPAPDTIASTCRSLLGRPWDGASIQEHAARFSEERFGAALQSVVGASYTAPTAGGLGVG